MRNFLSLSRCPAGVFAATLFVSSVLYQHEAVAFVPATQKNGICTNIKPLLSSTASPELKVSDSTTSKMAQKQTKKSQNQNSPRRKRRRGKEKNNTKSFKPLKDLKLGSRVSGTVVDVCDFGAFVNIRYATRGSRAGTALLHVSKIRNDKIDNIHEVVKKGDVIEGARVINIDFKKGEVALSLRKPRPKRRDFTKLTIGDELNGKVDKVVSYGAFVDVGVSINALLHISRITGGPIGNVRHHLNEGDEVSVHVIDIDNEKKTVAVSMLDKKADQYFDRRMSWRLKRVYGLAASKDALAEPPGVTSDSQFDQAIRELEEALHEREQ